MAQPLFQDFQHIPNSLLLIHLNLLPFLEQFSIAQVTLQIHHTGIDLEPLVLGPLSPECGHPWFI